MKLRLKVFTLLVISYLLIFIILQFSSNSFLLRGMKELENQEVREETVRGLASINHRVTEIEETTNRFSSYESIYNYVTSSETESDEHIRGVFTEAALSESDVNYALLFDVTGEVVFKRGYDLNSKENKSVPGELIDFFEMHSILVTHQTAQSKLSGIIRTPVGLFVISSQPISGDNQRIVGSLVLCRVIDTQMKESMEKSSLLSLNLIPLQDSIEEYEYEDILNQLGEEVIPIVRWEGEKINGYTVLNDLYGSPVLLLKVESPGLIYKQGVKMVNYFVYSFVLIAVSIGMLVLLALNRLVVMPLSTLSDEVSIINASTINDKSVKIPGDDEISSLSRDIDKMLKNLREYQNKIKETERMVSIGATATMVGHDLRNPLQVVFMLTDLIQKRLQWIKKEETREIEDIVNLIERIKNQATYMNKIVSDLQGLTEGIRLDIEDVNIIDLVQEVLETIQIPDNIEEKMFFEEDFPEIYADKNKLKRVFTNLITNAVQAMTNGGELVIKGFRLEDEVYISVVDTGCGISEEYLDNIFDPLFTTKARGTGLGLTVCKRIAEAHGGKIITKSHSGIGSCFTVVLPVNRKLESLDQNPEAFMDYEIPQSHILPLSLV